MGEEGAISAKDSKTFIIKFNFVNFSEILTYSQKIGESFFKNLFSMCKFKMFRETDISTCIKLGLYDLLSGILYMFYVGSLFREE